MGYLCQSPRLRSAYSNHQSSLANAGVVASYIQEDQNAGRIVDPVTGQMRQSIHCSPIGLVPKGRGTGQWRMIVDPSHASVNDGIAHDLCSLKYTSVDDAVHFITRLGQSTQLIKVDLMSILNCSIQLAVKAGKNHVY